MSERAIPKDARIAVTGANGFVGKNLLVRLGEAGFTAIAALTRETGEREFAEAIGSADAIFNLAGANRPEDPAEFYKANRDYVARICDAIEAGGRRPLVIHSGSAKAGDANDYGQSKLQGEEILAARADELGFAAVIQRLPNIFGKWARPNYNSGIATFCHNVARGLAITVNDPAAPLSLIYVDDLIDQWLEILADPPAGVTRPEARQVYHTTVGEASQTIQGFASDRENALIGPVGVGLTRALYATYVAALPESEFAYPLVAHTDPRGSFSEMLKTRESGQFSYFTAHPGVTRGGHYHHTKTEKFLIVAGEALFRFRHILTGATHEVRTSAAVPTVVETIPGWAHDVTNVGDTEMVSLLWANEIFDRERPDTVGHTV
ncbi:polysaccharide biosynthesis C-terminal domain-containing protein [Tsuneonella sp. HG222]